MTNINTTIEEFEALAAAAGFGTTDSSEDTVEIYADNRDDLYESDFINESQPGWDFVEIEECRTNLGKYRAIFQKEDLGK